ncbi:hypothetical protein E8P82_13250 [Arthrobacter echini]|uniref:Uncharacterized protein n=1 Tax=Arthrobacter echini TaxID=1529066 RepID=A0A4S5E0U3_9MICC|nr:hypothetical protein [Arthrobacter echini]THJ64954.1 hypothetical protein E8P82_13250 [Arthrobacter echini]
MSHYPSRPARVIMHSALAAAFLAGCMAAAPALAAHPPTPRLSETQQPQPVATFSEPAPPVGDPTATAGTDPVTGFAINARTGFLVHPSTGYLIEPETGYLVFADTLIYTNLKYDAATGEVSEIPGEIAVPTPRPDGARSTAAPSAPGATPGTDTPGTETPGTDTPATQTPGGATQDTQPPNTESQAAPERSGKEVATGTVEARVTITPPVAANQGATSDATPAATPSSSRTSTSAVAVLADSERASALAPAAWIGGGLVVVMVAAVVGVGVLGRGRHQS